MQMQMMTDEDLLAFPCKFKKAIKEIAPAPASQLFIIFHLSSTSTLIIMTKLSKLETEAKTLAEELEVSPLEWMVALLASISQSRPFLFFNEKQ